MEVHRETKWSVEIFALKETSSQRGNEQHRPKKHKTVRKRLWGWKEPNNEKKDRCQKSETARDG